MATEYYVAPDGSDSSGTGTKSDPFATLQPVEDRLNSASNPEGTTVYLRDGTYQFSQQFRPDWGVGGTEGSPITIRAYQDENPVLDYSNASHPAGNGSIFIFGPYWEIRDLEIANSPGRGIKFQGGQATDCLVDGCDIHHHRLAGVDFYNAGGNHLIRDCDLHHATYEGGGDGGRVSDTSGTVTYENCRAYYNNDDGYDCFNCPPGLVTFKNCWAWANGYYSEDNRSEAGGGNGFKLGGSDNSGGHTVHHCVSYDNFRRGFDDNTASNQIDVYNCTSVGNPSTNFRFNHGPHVLKNNISWNGGDPHLSSDATSEFNSWDLSIDDPKFDTTDPSKDGFLTPTADSPVIDAGTDVGYEYSGDAPDLGWREYASVSVGGRRDRFADLEVADELVIRGNDGNDYRIEVDSSGNLSATGPL